MSKYLPLFWDKCQIRALIYRIYINIFAIFLRILILPMGFSLKYKTIDIYYKGDDLIIFWKKGIRRYQSINSGGEFFTLKEVDEFWKRYREYCRNHLSNMGDFEL